MPNTTPPWQRRSRRSSGTAGAETQATTETESSSTVVGDPIPLEAPNPPTQALRSTAPPDYEPQDLSGGDEDHAWSEQAGDDAPEPQAPIEQEPAALPAGFTTSAGPVPIEPREQAQPRRVAPESWLAVVIAVIALAVALGTVLLGEDDPAQPGGSGVATAVRVCVDAQDDVLEAIQNGASLRQVDAFIADQDTACRKAENVANSVGD